jgi:hypothetical protein
MIFYQKQKNVSKTLFSWVVLIVFFNQILAQQNNPPYMYGTNNLPMLR